MSCQVPLVVGELGGNSYYVVYFGVISVLFKQQGPTMGAPALLINHQGASGPAEELESVMEIHISKRQSLNGCLDDGAGEDCV